jgi:CBS domain-containing protein
LLIANLSLTVEAAMFTATKSFLDLTASDLMGREVVTLHKDMALPDAARLLAAARISGAPVVDADGRCVGVLSQSDLARSVGQAPPAPGDSGEFFADWQVAGPDALPPDAVARHMSEDVITAYPDSTVREMARLMAAFRIHRLIITDFDLRVCGVVSAMDLVGAIAAGPGEAH